MPQPTPSRRATLSSIAGLTLIELILACSILLILSSAAMPIARITVKRQKEAELRRDLREMRNAIDRYKDAADKNQIRTEVGSQGYPPDLQTLVDGVTVSVGGNTRRPAHRRSGPALQVARRRSDLQPARWVKRCRPHQARCDSCAKSRWTQ
jgi:type II secretory pathway pseudopilin PulG